MTEAPPPGWYDDPAGRHDERRWDGQRWTEDVRDAGTHATDPLVDDGPREAWEYDVTEMKESFFGKTPSAALQRTLNEKGARGWRYKGMVGGDVTGTFGGKKDGWMLVMERRRP